MKLREYPLIRLITCRRKLLRGLRWFIALLAAAIGALSTHSNVTRKEV